MSAVTDGVVDTWQHVSYTYCLVETIYDFARHDSWRCDHPDRYPQDEDCPCGLLGRLAKLDLDPEPWRVPVRDEMGG